MNTKLTLSIDRAVIEDAKKNLQTKEESLSSLIENYFRVLLAKTKQTPSAPLVEELSGIVSLPQGTNARDVTTDYLLKKYK